MYCVYVQAYHKNSINLRRAYKKGGGGGLISNHKFWTKFNVSSCSKILLCKLANYHMQQNLNVLIQINGIYLNCPSKIY